MMERETRLELATSTLAISRGAMPTTAHPCQHWPRAARLTSHMAGIGAQVWACCGQSRNLLTS